MTPLYVLADANLIERFSKGFESLGAEWVMWLMIFLSVISVAIMIERIIYFSTHSIGNVDDIAEKLASGDLQGAVSAVGSKNGMEAEVVRQAVKTAPKGAEAVEEIVQSVILRERLRYERFLSYLGTLGNNAPFIGLFGTVLGIITAFAELAKSAKSGNMSGGSSSIMGGISEALVSTAVGLVVALPAVAFYNTFGRWLKTIVSRSETLSHALASHLKSETPAATPPEKKS